MTASLSQQHPGAPTRGEAKAFGFKEKSQSENEQNAEVLAAPPSHP